MRMERSVQHKSDKKKRIARESAVKLAVEETGRACFG
jgi:hypothetical protein